MNRWESPLLVGEICPIVGFYSTGKTDYMTFPIPGVGQLADHGAEGDREIARELALVISLRGDSTSNKSG